MARFGYFCKCTGHSRQLVANRWSYVCLQADANNCFECLVSNQQLFYFFYYVQNFLWFYLLYNNHLYFFSDLPYINKVYKKAYCRIGPYCIGILMAHVYLKYKGVIKIPKVLKRIN